MRMLAGKKVKLTQKKHKMKHNNTKKKKSLAKASDDKIAETISFVVNGHLSQLKSTVICKKPTVSKKNVKILSKSRVIETTQKQQQNTTISKKNHDTRKIKATTKKCPEVKTKNTKMVKETNVPRKQTKKNSPEVASLSVLSDDVGKSATSHNVSEKNKPERLPRKAIKVKATKVKTRNVKKLIKNDIVLRHKSPAKSEVVEKEKPKEKKSDVLIKKVKKVAVIKESTPVVIQQKSKISKLKQVKVKPKKPPVSSVEHKSVKEDIKVVTTKIPKSNVSKDEIHVKTESVDKKSKKSNRKIKVEDDHLSTDESSSTSDEITLDELRQNNTVGVKTDVNVVSKKISNKATGNLKKKKCKLITKSPVKPKVVLIKKGILNKKKNKTKCKIDQRTRKLKLYGFWNGPKRHRVASLNALAKVHCLYENETRGALIDGELIKSEFVERKVEPKQEEVDEVLPTRTLRSAPGLRGAGRHWEMHDDAFSSSEDNESPVETVEPEPEKKPEKKRPYVKRKRNRCELIMDLKDMVVRKRMASLNASAILAASYSVEKRSSKSSKSESSDSEDSEDSFIHPAENNKKKCFEDDVKKEEDRKVIEVQAAPNKKVSVILNQDTDVTITGVYVNSTTRSTHHEGYCSIAGMQYRISAKSHTQTASTTVATETILQSAANMGQENAVAENPPHTCKSYAPLTALSSMQPPGTPVQPGVPIPPQHVGPPHVIPLSSAQHIPHTSPISRRHGCTSAFSAPPAPYGPPPPAHHSSTSAPPTDPNFIHGYYQPAGPLINVPQHGHPSSTSLGKTAPLSEVSSSPTPPPSHQTHSQSSTTDSLDSDVIITSATTAKETVPPHQSQPPPPPTYRYSQYPTPHPGYAYGYPPQYYPSPHHPVAYHHDLCYPNPYLHHKPYPPPTFRRHLTAPAGTQYYQANPPDIYHPPPAVSTQQNQQVVTANPSSNNTYQSPSSGPPPTLIDTYPPPPTLVEPYPPPPHYYPGYGPAPPPACYTHSPPTRTLPYLNAAYQSCPCPMQSCPKNVHTGPLTGDSKRSSHITSIAKDSLPLPPVALALPLEPVSATGPPSPARGSAGMPPPPSPAGATYQPPPAPKQEEVESLDCKPIEKKRKARVGKNMVRNNIAANFPENTMLLMCHQPPPQDICVTNVKREIESPEEIKMCLTEVLASKIEASEITPCSEIDAETMNGKNQESTIFPCWKTEEDRLKEPLLSTKIESEQSSKLVEDEHLPCQKTVAENVKVKNMKRKLSITKESEKVETDLIPVKKSKVDKTQVNGSYKDLIKKNVPSIKINNGKRKLNIDAIKPILIKNSKLKFRKSSLKRKLSPCNEDLISKRLKVSKPLIASNLHNFKQNLKSNKGKCFIDFELSENKEPHRKTVKKFQVNSKNSINDKKLAPAILDNLFSKNNVDRTIECVINRYSESSRTTTSKKTDIYKSDEKSKKLKICSNNQQFATNKSTNNNVNSELNKIKPVVAKKIGASKRKSKRKSVEVPVQTVQKVSRRHLQIPKWSNGWTWIGEPYQAKVFLNSDETVVIRKCYPAMMHSEGDTIEPRDCVLLKAGPRRNDLPFVAKVAALWENPEDGEMMMSLLWYYRPEHTEQGRQGCDEPDEVFASRHKDTNSVACIEDKCYVLTFNEYCRYRKSLKRIEEGLEDTTTCIPIPEPYPRTHRQPPSTFQTPHDLIFFCRRVYDFRQKRIVKNPS
ncbi:hypothetical protein RN001_003047 [Aquatica leii]|uniref:BAH domain-containing protein n=1 Tax=Aquatica leii TaxID=1421715 RepID=A0AAN7PQM7_9COLE|nr:hypothetical protein RN001_003047 [Aquatica leii]